MPLPVEPIDPFDPQAMCPDDCLDEIAGLLARGVVRLHGRIPQDIADSEIVADSSSSCLDDSAVSRPDRPAG